MTLAAIFGSSGPQLTADERAFFRDADPLGFILFRRNCENRDQTRRLVDAMRETVGRADAPVLIDQEGGRVARLRPPEWRMSLPAARFGTLAHRQPDSAIEGARLNARLLAAELSELGITVNCAPVLDLQLPGAHEAIGDRAFGADPKVVAALGRATCEGLLAGGVLPVIKHMPGHGRAKVDSHHQLPRVDTRLEELRATDFHPFRELRGMPWGISAHVVYTGIDPERPATVSPQVVREIIRGDIGFQGLLLTDDISMNALTGDVAARSRAAIAAGCDVVLHCNGEMPEMKAVATAAGALTSDALGRLARGKAALPQGHAVDVAALEARLQKLLLAS